MIDVLSFLAFGLLIAAQFLAVVFVHNARIEEEATGRKLTCDEARLWNTWLLA